MNSTIALTAGTKVLVNVGSDRYEGLVLHVSKGGHHARICYGSELTLLAAQYIAEGTQKEASLFTLRDDGCYRMVGCQSLFSVSEWYEGGEYRDPSF